MVRIDLKMKVRRRILGSGAADIADQFPGSHRLADHDTVGISQQMHIAVAATVISRQHQHDATGRGRRQSMDDAGGYSVELCTFRGKNIGRPVGPAAAPWSPHVSRKVKELATGKQ